MRKTLIIASVLVAGVGALAFMAGQEVLAKYEEPQYKVSEKEGDIEFREYPSVIAAQVQVVGTGKEAANQAFKILAGYIFGKNVRKDKIAMTVPVTESKVSEKIAMTIPVTTLNNQGEMLMSFYMPSKYSMNDLPEALDKRIQFNRVEPRKFAVIKFSGAATEENMQKHEDQLREYLRSKGKNSTGTAIRAFYNPPWTLPFMRRNEVWIQLG